MNLEQRLAAAEKTLADLQNKNKINEEIRNPFIKSCKEAISKAFRPGGIIYRSVNIKKTAHIKAAVFKVEHGSVNISQNKINASVKG